MKNLGRLLLGVIAVTAVTALLSLRAYGRDSNGDIVIIVDPGHGGNDGGSASAYDSESDLNWQIAAALKAELQTYEGVRVYLTRGSAEWNSNTARGRMGAELGADLFVSVHNNSSTNASVSGVEVYGTVNASYKEQVRPLCDMIAGRVGALGLTNRGYHARGSTDDPSVDFYTMLDEAVKCGIPGLIIEHCYLSNAGDAAFINSPENRVKCGIADAAAIAEYYGLSKRGVAAGDAVTLIRTYSACMTGASGTYSSSDASVAYVSPEGVITAVGEGSAVIACSEADGTQKSVTVTVPAVAMTGLAAGINPTFYSDPSAASAYDKSKVMVKAIYSDGHAEQLSGGFALGAFPASDNGIFDVEVSYNGFKCPLRIYGVGGYLGNYNANNYKVTGTNEDILRLPPVYNGINTGIKITTGGSMQASAPVAKPTEPPIEPA
ncbi:MAG: N-acetylmuramoyl-L-alanine amidase, partial [Butyrivibrio sp.]|nr:N-acetylmuramoyl-L-alanine amidase [Butyrivibrio sp.]